MVWQALQSMDISRELLDRNVANEIPHFQQAWRKEPVDWVCIRNLLVVFRVWQAVGFRPWLLPRDLARVVSALQVQAVLYDGEQQVALDHCQCDALSHPLCDA